MTGRNKAELRRKFCRDMGWEVSKDGCIVTGADGRVLMNRNKGYVNGYLDGLHDGLKGNPWDRSRRSDE